MPVLHGKRDATRVVRVSLTKRRSRGDSSALIVGHSHTYGHYTSPYPREVLIGNGGAPLTSTTKDYGFGLFKQRSDGAILWLRSKLIVRLELPAAHEYETKLKAEKEQKARESVPQF